MRMYITAMATTMAQDDIGRGPLTLARHAAATLSFFWNHRVLPGLGDWYQEMSLLDLIQPSGPILQVEKMELSALCPGKDIDLCPAFNPQTVMFNDPCAWLPERRAT